MRAGTLGVMLSAALALLAAATGQPALLHALSCQCNVTTGVALRREGPPLHVILPTRASSANLTHIVNPLLNRDVTFACSCEASSLGEVQGGRQYILSARQTDVVAGSASSCLGSQLMASVCTGLRALRLFECESEWRSGIAGRTADGLTTNGVLLAATKQLCVSFAGPCARTIEFDDILDEVVGFGFQQGNVL